jgi:hypothetical protein
MKWTVGLVLVVGCGGDPFLEAPFYLDGTWSTDGEVILDDAGNPVTSSLVSTDANSTDTGITAIRVQQTDAGQIADVSPWLDATHRDAPTVSVDAGFDADLMPIACVPVVSVDCPPNMCSRMAAPGADAAAPPFWCPMAVTDNDAYFGWGACSVATSQVNQAQGASGCTGTGETCWCTDDSECPFKPRAGVQTGCVPWAGCLNCTGGWLNPGDLSGLHPVFIDGGPNGETWDCRHCL